MLEVKGYNGTIVFDGQAVRIERTGFVARTTLGSGSKTIPVRQITAVQLVPAKLGFRGYIEFSIGGGVERRATFGKRTEAAGRDENSVLFSRQDNLAFAELRAAIESAMFAATEHGAAAAQPADLPDQLRRLADLRDTGVIGSDEFTTAKARLLGSVTA